MFSFSFLLTKISSQGITLYGVIASPSLGAISHLPPEIPQAPPSLISASPGAPALGWCPSVSPQGSQTCTSRLSPPKPAPLCGQGGVPWGPTWCPNVYKKMGELKAYRATYDLHRTEVSGQSFLLSSSDGQSWDTFCTGPQVVLQNRMTSSLCCRQLTNTASFFPWDHTLHVSSYRPFVQPLLSAEPRLWYSGNEQGKK